jgi:hypothetical protein
VECTCKAKPNACHAVDCPVYYNGQARRIAELEHKLEEHQHIHAENILYAKELEKRLAEVRPAAQALIDNAEVTSQGYVLINADLYFEIAEALKGD